MSLVHVFTARRTIATLIAAAGVAAAPLAVSAEPNDKLPTIDLVPVANWAVGGDPLRAPSAPGGLPQRGISGEIRLNALLTQPLAKNLVFQYEYTSGAGYDTTIGRETSAPTATGQQPYIYPGDVRDIVQEFRVRYASHGLAATGGYYYRYRVCCPGVNDPTNLTPADWHATYAQLTYSTTPLPKFADASFFYNIRGTYNKHHASATYLASLPSLPPGQNGYTDSEGKIQTGINQTVGTSFALDKQHGFSAFSSFSWGAFDFFDNAPITYNYTIVDAGVTKTFNKNFSMTADWNNLAQRPSNYPFFPPNAIHRAYFAVSADIKIPVARLLGR